MQPRVLRLGFVGGGLDSDVGTTHKIASQMDGRWHLEAGCFCPDDAVNKATAASWGIHRSRLYPRWRDLIDAELDTLDAIAVLTPIPSHADVVLAAIEAGYSVICEKAMASSAADAACIRRAVEKHNAFLAVIYNYTGYPMLRELRGMIQRGQFGQLIQVLVEMPQEGFLRLDNQGRPRRPQVWRLCDPAVPMISLDIGVHLHHLLRFLTGRRPCDLVATQDSLGFYPQVVDNVVCIARYPGNLLCQMWYSKSALGHRNGLRVRIYGDRGSAEWYQMDPEALHCRDNTGRQSVVDRASAGVQFAAAARYNRFKPGHPAGFIEAFANYYYDLADDLQEFEATGRHSNPWVFTVDDAEEGLVMMEAIAASARLHAWQAVDFKPAALDAGHP